MVQMKMHEGLNFVKLIRWNKTVFRFFKYLMSGSVADKDARLAEVDAVTAIEL